MFLYSWTVPYFCDKTNADKIEIKCYEYARVNFCKSNFQESASDGEETSVTVTLLAYRKVVGVKTCHSPMIFGGYGTTFTCFSPCCLVSLTERYASAVIKLFDIGSDRRNASSINVIIPTSSAA